MSNDNEWYKPPIGAAQIKHNELVMARDLRSLGFNRGCAASVIGWARALSIINPAYVGTSYSTNQAFGLLSWDRTITNFYSYVIGLGYASTSGYGQLLAFDQYGPSMVRNATSMSNQEFWNYFFKNRPGSGGAYDMWHNYLSEYLPERVYDSLYDLARDYIKQAYDDIAGAYAPSAWLYFEMSKRKKGGGKLYL